MHTTGSTSTNHQVPDQIVVLRVLHELVEAEDWRGVIRLVERWSEFIDLPREGRLIEARALLSLCLMDRAWVRLRELTDADSDDIEALELTARMFIQRGWPGRARKMVKVLQGRSPGRAGLDELEQAAAAPPRQPPADAAEIERSGTPEQLLDLAERYLATGSIIRSRSLLERVQRESRGRRRADDLLWAIQGDFASSGLSFAELLDEVRPVDPLTEWDGPDNTESMDLGTFDSPDPETAEVRATSHGVSGLGGLSGGADGGSALDRHKAAFPALFRKPGEIHTENTMPRDDDEVTVAAVLSDKEDIGDPPTEEVTDDDFADLSDGRGDTQIMQVIPSGDGARLAPLTGGSVGASADDVHRQTLNLRSWQKNQGGAASRPLDGDTLIDEDDDDPVDDDGFLEAEDEDLVVMTRRESSPEEPTEPPSPRRGPIEVIEKVPVPDAAVLAARAAESRQSALAADAPRSPAPGPSASASSVPTVIIEPPDEPLGSGAWRWNRVMFGLVVMAMLVAGLGFGMIQFFAYVAGNDIVDEVHRTLDAGNLKALQDLEARLDAQVQSRRIPVGVRATELALVRTVLWTELTGDPRDLTGAEEALEIARDAGAPPQEAALVRGLLALSRGDLRSAAFFGQRAGVGSREARRLRARLALAQSDSQAALDAWGDLDAPVGGVRHAVFVPWLLAQAGQQDAALERGRALLERSGGEVEVLIGAYEQDWVRAPAVERLSALDQLFMERQNVLSARQAGRVQAARARLLEEIGQDEDALRAWQKAQAVDPTHPEYLYQLGVAELLNGRATGSEQYLSRCLDLYPYQPRCARAQVFVLLDLDRVVPARTLTTRWATAGLDAHTAEGWVLLAEDRYTEAAAFAQARLEAPRSAGVELPHSESGSLFYTLGIALGEQPSGDLSHAPRALLKAQRTLLGTDDPLDHALALRAGAAALLYDPQGSKGAALRAQVESASQDPVAEVYVARYYERGKRRAAAAQHYDNAAAIGPENGTALYWRGLFNLESGGDRRRARESWQRYLDLGPSGARADRVRSSPLLAGRGR